MSNQTYDIVTEKIIEMLEAGTAPWHKPWNAEMGMPRSLSTGKRYRGINIWLLGSSMYTSPWWGTYRQITERDSQVRRGERGTLVVFWKKTKRRVTDDSGEESDRAGFILRYYKVFNAEQCEPSLIVPEIPGSEVYEHEPIEAAQEVADGYFAASGAPGFRVGGGRASYSPGADVVSMPQREAFHSGEEYYSTHFHEMTHSTGHSARLARPDLLASHSFGDENYSREELVAEMGAAMLSGFTGIDQVTLPSSAAYLAHWVKVLRGDTRLVVTAAAQAQRAADWIAGIRYEEDSPVEAAAA